MSSLHDRLLAVCAAARSQVSWRLLDPLTDRRISTQLGFSDAKLRLLVEKTDTTSGEGELAVRLGPKVCPIVTTITETSYVAEYVPHRVLDERTLLGVHDLLERAVWSRDVIPSRWWVSAHEQRFGRAPPDWITDEPQRLTHGDPTLANVRQPSPNSDSLRLLDPKPPRAGVPSTISVDRGKMIQSMLGWELILGFNFPEQISPFAADDDLSLRRAVFWARVHLARVDQRNATIKNVRVAAWTRDVAPKLEEMISS